MKERRKFKWFEFAMAALTASSLSLSTLPFTYAASPSATKRSTAQPANGADTANASSATNAPNTTHSSDSANTSNLAKNPGARRAPASAKGKSSQVASVELSSNEVKNGSVLLIQVKFQPGAVTVSPKAVFEDIEVPFFLASPSDPSLYHGLLGIPYTHAPGDAVVTVHLGETEGSEVRDLKFKIIEGEYKSEMLTVNPRHVNPRRKDQVRIKREAAEVSQLYGKVTTAKEWNGPFILPIESQVTSTFGTRRVFNGEMKSFHSGLDLKAAVGARIKAPAGGSVVLAKNLFYTGNTVILDHGYGVFTIYAHLSKLRVKEGQKVKASQLLGLAGMTGRVSGPHLHWGAVVHRVKVNPLDLMRIIQ